MKTPLERYAELRLKDSKELRDLEVELEDAERRLQEAEDEVAGIKQDIAELKKQLKTKPTCPRCGLKQTPEPELNAICCPKCGYCEAAADGVPEACSYHGEMSA